MNHKIFFHFFLLVCCTLSLSACLGGGGNGQANSANKRIVHTLTLLTDSQTQLADGNAQIELTVLVRDENNAPINNAEVTFKSSSNTLEFTAFSGATDAQGYFTTHIKNRTAETLTLTAQSQDKSSNPLSIRFITPVEEPSAPASIELMASTTSLSLNGSTSITAVVRDALGEQVADGTSITFSTDVGAITATATTLNGQASATFSASIESGLATVKADAGTASAQISLTIQSEQAGTIEVQRVHPATIGILNSGVTQSSTITFLVKDALGNHVADGTSVKFSLGTSTLGGGETISTQGESGKQAQAMTSNGLVSVMLKSGRVSGIVDVIASVNNVSTVARITIVGGMPDGDRLSIAVEKRNIAGGVKFGLTDTITAYVADRVGNIVPNGTAVSFITEGGTIGRNDVDGKAFNATTALGQASAILQTAAPTTPHLGGLNYATQTGYQCNTPYQAVDDEEQACGNPGLNTIVAYTTGNESFIDNNGNGLFDQDIDKHTDLGYLDVNHNHRWDLGEIITNKGDYSEPYIDANDSNTFEVGEFYIDVNGNGQFDGPDGQFTANTLIWRSTKVVFSAQTQPVLQLLRAGKVIKNGQKGAFTITTDNPDALFLVTNLTDIYGNALPEGTQLKIETTGGVLGGQFDETFKDALTSSGRAIFSLAGDVETSFYGVVTVTIRLSSATNGDAIPFVFSGIINIAAPEQAE